MNQTLDLIKKELNRIHKPNWLTAVLKLDEHFRGYPFDDDSQAPAAAIFEILKDIDANDAPEERFVSRVRQLDAFTFRAYYLDQDANAVYWNPLQERFLEFSNNKTIRYQADMEYPATDIIRLWLYTQITH